MPRGRSFGLAHAAEQHVHVGPGFLPLLAFRLPQPGVNALARPLRPPSLLQLRLRLQICQRIIILVREPQAESPLQFFVDDFYDQNVDAFL